MVTRVVIKWYAFSEGAPYRAEHAASDVNLAVVSSCPRCSTVMKICSQLGIELCFLVSVREQNDFNSSFFKYSLVQTDLATNILIRTQL